MSKTIAGRLIKVILLSTACVLLTACGGLDLQLAGKAAGTLTYAATDAGTTEKSSVTLKLWHIWATDSESNKKPFETALASWNKAHPDIPVEADATENETYKTKIRIAVAVNEAPDIFYCWGAGFAKPFVDSGKVLALDGYLDEGLKGRLLPGTLDYFTYDGKIYGLPIYMIAGVMYCNTELFDTCGLELPTTFDDLVAAVKAFREKGITPMAVGEKDGWTGMFYQNILAIRTAGTKLCNKALGKEASFNRREFAESAARLGELIKAGAFDSKCMSMTRDEAEADFRDGKIPMYYNGSWVAGTLDRYDSQVKGKIAVRNFPYIVGAGGDPDGFLGGAIDTFMVSSDTKYKDEAVSALKYMDEAFCRESYLAGATQPAWKTDVDEASIDPLSRDISSLLKGSTGFVLAWDTFLTASEADTHINLVADLFSGKISPEDFAAKMQKINETGYKAQSETH